MRKIICDKCQKVIDLECETWELSVVRPSGSTHTYESILIDLCNKCWEEIKEFIFRDY